MLARGHGTSEAPVGAYDFDILVEDLRRLLDRLRVNRASLLGHSMGGNEITEFARLYPKRVDHLVYLEGGYDWSDQNLWKLHGDVPVAAAATLASFDAYRKWQNDTWWPDNE